MVTLLFLLFPVKTKTLYNSVNAKRK
jgi:hypothetical protein